MLSLSLDSAVQQEPQSVVVQVAESVAGAFHLFDQQVGGFGRSVGHTAGVEVGQQLGAPGVDGAGQAVQFGDVGVGAVGQPPVQPLLGVSAVSGVIRRRSWAAIQVRLIWASMSPTSRPVSSRAQACGVSRSARRRSSRRMR